MYRVFLGAPSLSTLTSTTEGDSNVSSEGYPPTQPTYHWQTISSTDTVQPPPLPPSHGSSSYILWPIRGGGTQSAVLKKADSFVYPPATLEAASRRISMIYKNAIFDLTTGNEDALDDGEGESFEEVGEGRRGDQTSLISWPPTNADDTSKSHIQTRGSLFRDPSSFLLDGSDDVDASKSNAEDVSTSRVSDSSILETQETQSFNYSDASSIGRFPTFHFNIHTLSTLPHFTRPGGGGAYPRGRKYNFLLAILEVDGPEMITLKKGPDAGKQVGLLKLILGDDAGSVCKLTAWREVAEEWGGVGQTAGCKRGDVVFIESVTVDCEPSMSPTLAASPNLKSKMVVCYRSMPHAHEDGLYRPDLRLGESDPCVRKVATVVKWFEDMAGLSGAGR